MPWEGFAEAEAWHAKLFDFAKKETARHKYAYFLRTDGISVSITMRRPARARNSSDSSASGASKGTNPEEMEFQGGLDVEGSVVYGLDPGRRSLFTATGTDGKHKSCSSREYRERIGVHKRQRRIERWLRKAHLATHLDNMPTDQVMTSALLEHHIRYVFHNGRLDKVLRFYGSVRYRKFKQDGFYAREREFSMC